MLFSKNLCLDVSKLSDDIIYLLPNSDTRDIFAPGVPEQSLIDWSKTLMDADGLFVDIGAHVGTYSLNFAKTGMNVVAFECQKNTYDCLVANIALNNLSDKIVAHRTSLSYAKTSDTPLYIVSTDGGGSSIKKLPTNKTYITKQWVKVNCLDDYCLSPQLIKIDVEGAELYVLMGAADTISRCKPKILIEIWNHDWYVPEKEKIIDHFHSIDYKLVSINGYPQMFIAEPK